MRYQFVDCRWELGNPGRGRELYLAGHIPGASFLDVEADLSSPPGPGGRHPLPEPGQFAAEAGRAGIGDGVFVVAYGSMGGAERLWWLLRHHGHHDCAVLELDGWLGELRAGEEQVEPGRLTLRERSGDTIHAYAEVNVKDQAEVEAALWIFGGLYLGIGLPVVIRMEGTNVEEGQRILRESGFNFTVADGMKDAAEKVVALAGGKR